LSREHAVARPQPGLISIAGGKYTTYRVMAKDAIDAALEDISSGAPHSVTEHIPLAGAEGYHAMVNQVDKLAGRAGVPAWRMQRLLDRYGSLTEELLALADDDASLLEPLEGAEEYIRAEIVYAASHEAAQHLDDVLARRTRISIETPDRGTASAEATARLVAPYLGWDEERITNETQAYSDRVEAERRSQLQEDDLAADAARVAAPDTRAVAVGRALD
jgi:glycerol-3-phosphate dehydrogenase